LVRQVEVLEEERDSLSSTEGAQQPIQMPWSRVRTPWDTRSQCIRKFLRPGISTRIFLDFLRLHANVENVPKIQVDTAWFSCDPPILIYQNESLLTRPQHYIPDNALQSITYSKLHWSCPQWLTKLTILTYFNNVFSDTQAIEHCSELTHSAVGCVL
jgi:hypothetical protein